MSATHEEAIEASPSVSEVDPNHPDFLLIELLALVTMKLTSYRRKDQVHLLDMIGIGQFDASWLSRVPPDPRISSTIRMAEGAFTGLRTPMTSRPA